MKTERPYRVVIADDHVMFRNGLKRILADKPELEVVGEASDGQELIQLLSLIPVIPDMAIVDISMPNLNGIEATSMIKRSYSGLKVLILSMHREKEYVRKALAAGADGYLLKEDTHTELFTAIDNIRNGRFYISPLISDMEDSWMSGLFPVLKVAFPVVP